MRRSIRATVFAFAASLALAVTALAAASYAPSMGIFQATYKPGDARGVTVVVAQEPGDDPTARIVVYVAPGYTATLGQAAGKTIGSVFAHVQMLDTGSTKRFELVGSVKAGNPANYPATTNLCTPGVTHEAVWTLNAAPRGQRANPIPVYVDHTTGTEAGFSSAKMTVCFANPTLPAGDPARAPRGTKFLDLAFTVRGIFRNPRTAGQALWRSIFTPYTPGTQAPNLAATREAQAVVPMPYSLSLRRTSARRGFFRVAGVLNLGGRRPGGIQVGLYAGVRGRQGIAFRRVAKTRTRGGKYVFNRRLPRRTTFVFVQREPSEVACGASASGAPCTAAIESNAISRVLRIVPAKRRR